MVLHTGVSMKWVRPLLVNWWFIDFGLPWINDIMITAPYPSLSQLKGALFVGTNLFRIPGVVEPSGISPVPRYKLGKDVFIAPYDWRLAGDAHSKRQNGVGGYYPQLQLLIEETVKARRWWGREDEILNFMAIFRGEYDFCWSWGRDVHLFLFSKNIFLNKPAPVHVPNCDKCEATGRQAVVLSHSLGCSSAGKVCWWGLTHTGKRKDSGWFQPSFRKAGKNTFIHSIPMGHGESENRFDCFFLILSLVFLCFSEDAPPSCTSSTSSCQRNGRRSTFTAGLPCHHLGWEGPTLWSPTWEDGRSVCPLGSFHMTMSGQFKWMPVVLWRQTSGTSGTPGRRVGWTICRWW